MRNTNDEKETRILYEYLAEGSVVFSKTFPVIHSLLDAKLTSSLSLCHDQVTIRAVQNIIQNMVVGGEIGQQQLHMLYSVGFGGLKKLFLYRNRNFNFLFSPNFQVFGAFQVPFLVKETNAVIMQSNS